MKFSWSESSNNASPPRLVLTRQDPEFDQTTIENWQTEGFAVTYLPFVGSHREFERTIAHLPDPLELGEKYAIVAYGDAASVLLAMAQKPMPKLCTLVAYYPTRIPAPAAGFPSSLNVTVHLTQTMSFAPKYRHYTYPDVKPGFAEVDLEVYDKVAEALAWSRTLGAVRKGFEIDVDLESTWENHTKLGFRTKDVDATMSTMVAEPYVNHIPTMTGGIGHKDLRRFHQDFFVPGNPPSLKMKLISRTVGTDRVVDELFVSFRHTQEMPWMLPGIKATNKLVEVMLVAIVCIRGGKLYHEHIYWDQATVLVQIGLLDPTMLPEGAGKGNLPVVDKSSAHKVLDEKGIQSNQSMKGW